MILMLNCSYKSKDGNTRYFLEILKKELKESVSDACKMVNIKPVLEGGMENLVKDLREAKAFVIGAPLYVDGLPAQAVKLLELLLEQYKGEFPELPVYVVSNLGFYEPEQIKHLLAMVENWCIRMGMIYGGGLAIGAGPMISTLKQMPLKTGLNKDIGNGFGTLSKAIVQGTIMDDYYTKTSIPRFIYLKAAHMTFDRTAKRNGLTVKDVR